MRHHSHIKTVSEQAVLLRHGCLWWKGEAVGNGRRDLWRLGDRQCVQQGDFGRCEESQAQRHENRRIVRLVL